MKNTQKISLIKALRRAHKMKCEGLPCEECEKFEELLAEEE